MAKLNINTYIYMFVILHYMLLIYIMLIHRSSITISTKVYNVLHFGTNPNGLIDSSKPFPSACNMTKVYNVLNFDADPNGLIDSSKAFLSAWNAACNTLGTSMVLVPKGTFLLHPVEFLGKYCSSESVTFRLDGNLVAPGDFRVLGRGPRWIQFKEAKRVSFIGEGYLDANGFGLWACKKARDGNNCPRGASTITFRHSNNIVIKGITTLNSQLFHIVLHGCNNVHIESVRIRANRNSPNTDGIHVEKTMDVTIFNSTIKTGDDCISVGPGTRNLWIERIFCGPGHGISIGSLAKSKKEQGVQNVTVKTVVLNETTNGLRIKSWGRPSEGFARGVVFEDIRMDHVRYPIIIDQNYCPHNKGCPLEESGASVSDIIYRRVRGTSATKVAMKFDCSRSTPCTRLTLHNVSLSYKQGTATATTSCTNAFGNIIGFLQPTTCF